MILVDQDSKILTVNKCTEVLFGYSPNELIGKDISLLVPEDVRSKHPKLVKSYFDYPLPRKMGLGRNLFGVKKSKKLFPIEVGLTPVKENEEIFVLTSVIDITERINAEKKFRAAFDAAPCSMIMVNQDGKIILANQKTEQIFGYMKEEIIDKNIETLVPDETKLQHPTFVKSYILDPKPRGMGLGRELFGRHKSGKQIPVEIGLQPIFFDGEKFVISSILDITKRKESEVTIQDKSDEIQQFSYRTSHDLKAPLLSISGLTDFVLDDLDDGNIEESRLNIQKIKSLTTQLSTLVDDILALTKIDFEEEVKSFFKFNNFIENVKLKFSHLINQNNINIETSFLHKKELSVQPTRLTQILDNLICNAMKYCDKNKDKSEITVSTFSDKTKFYIQVEDNGIGIPEEHQSEVFDMFKRFHDESVKGSGLGLYIIKKHIEKIGAKIDFESSKSGTSFYLEITF